MKLRNATLADAEAIRRLPGVESVAPLTLSGSVAAHLGAGLKTWRRPEDPPPLYKMGLNPPFYIAKFT